jgi:hypothetical protein
MDVLLGSAIHALDTLTGVVHALLEQLVVKHDVWTPLLTILLVSSFIAIPCSLFSAVVVLGCRDSCRRKGAQGGLYVGKKIESIHPKQTLQAAWVDFCCPSREISLKVRASGELQWRRFAIRRRDLRSMELFQGAVLQKLQAGAGTKISAMTLLPDIALVDEADIRSLQSGNEVEVQLKE